MTVRLSNGSSRPRSDRERWQAQVACLGGRDFGDREILDCEAGRVEQRDVARAPSSIGFACEDEPDLGDPVPGYDPRQNARGQLAAVARLLAVVAELTT